MNKSKHEEVLDLISLTKSVLVKQDNGGYKVYKFSKEELKIIEELVDKVRQDLLSRC